MLLVVPFSLVTVYGFLVRRDYLLAVLLVGHPILKLMLNPFGTRDNPVFLVVYFAIGFYCLGIVRLHNRKAVFMGKLTTKVSLSYFVFLAWLATTLLYTPARAYGVTKMLNFFASTLPMLLVLVLFMDSAESVKQSMRAIGNVALLVGVGTLIAVFVHTGSVLVRLGTSAAQDVRLFGINFAVSIWFGRRMGIGFLAMLGLTLVEPSLVNRVKLTALFVLTILSVSRGPIISLFATIVVLLVLGNRQSSGRPLFRSLLILGVSAFVMIGFVGTETSFTRLLTFYDRNVLGRMAMFEASLNLIKENMLGYGVGSFSVLSNLGLYPHNIFLEVFVELGLVGAFLLISPLTRGIIDGLKLTRQRFAPGLGVRIFGAGVLLFAILNAQFSGDIASNEYVWFGMMLVARIKELMVAPDMKLGNQHFPDIKRHQLKTALGTGETILAD